MTKRHPDNERVKRRYLQYLKDAKGRDEASLDAVAKAIARFEDYTGVRDFRKFHLEQVRAFKVHLTDCRNARTGKPLSAATIHSTLAMLKAFFEWLAQEPSYRSRIKHADAAYFSSPDNLARVATAHRYRECPTLEQIRAALAAMPTATEIERRDRALLAFAILTGARDRAIISFKLKHINTAGEKLEHDARQVRTKGAKTFTSWFFPVGDDIRQIVVDWVAFLRTEKQFSPEDPIFPKSRIQTGVDLKFRAAGLDQAHWANANPVRATFKEAFARIGAPYFNPHSVRNTLVQLAYDLRLNPEQFKSWSQNLGHESCQTTFSSYGTIPPARQAEIIRALGRPNSAPVDIPASDLLRRIADQMDATTRPA